MTYHDQQLVYRLTWPDEHDLAGVEVMCTATSLAALVAVDEFDRAMRKRRPVGPMMLAFSRVFVEHVESWTIRRNGRPVPVKHAAFLALDRDVVVFPLLRQWRELVLNPPREQPADIGGETGDDAVLDVPEIELDLVATRLTRPGDGEEQIEELDDVHVPVPALV